MSDVHTVEISRQEQRYYGFIANSDAFFKFLECVGFNVRKYGLESMLMRRSLLNLCYYPRSYSRHWNKKHKKVVSRGFVYVYAGNGSMCSEKKRISIPFNHPFLLSNIYVYIIVAILKTTAFFGFSPEADRNFFECRWSVRLRDGTAMCMIQLWYRIVAGCYAFYKFEAYFVLLGL